HAGPLIVYDGAQIRRYPGGDIEENDGLDVCVAREAAETIHRRHLRAIVQFSDGAGERLRVGPPGADIHHDAEYLARFVPQTAVVPVDELVPDGSRPLRVLVFGPLGALERASADLSGSRCATQVLPRGNYGAAELTVFSPTASKGNALLRLARRLDIPRERTFAIGDGLNDISMLRLAGLGVAMGNANATVRAAARAVAGDADHDGAALAIERYCLQ
ncbi:MAG TPA: HAD hydrolase family protein, partial [Ktedonobacterales bacterium]|nr:HAD hydrolase family protein [Ktedonobacterales bacterium]